MDKQSFLYMLIEAVVFLSAFIGMVIKVNTKFVSMEKDIERLKNNDEEQVAQYHVILTSIQNISISLARLEERLNLTNKGGNN